ncbi:MAG: nucleotidyltransferase family protein [Solirubrobacteraceae bacterium]
MTPAAQLGEAVRGSMGERPVLLLGSRALGTARPESDLDAYVVLPGWRVPFALAPLRALRARLESELGIAVSLNPLPARRLRPRPGTMLPFKLRREAVVVAAPSGWELGQVDAPPRDTGAFRSYAMTGLLFLLTAAAPVAGGSERLDRTTSHLVGKALLHAAQLELARRRAWATTLPEAVKSLGEPWPRLMFALDSPSGWIAARDALLPDAAAHAETRRETALRSLQWAALRTLRGIPTLPPVRRPSPAAALTRAACELAAAIAPGHVDLAAVARARRALPPRVQRSVGESEGWRGVARAIELEWPNASPLAGV